jgi:hypothetical protein
LDFGKNLIDPLALKARLISAMGEAHGLDIQGCSQVLAEIASIGKIGLRQNGWILFLPQTCPKVAHTKISQRTRGVVLVIFLT